MQRGNQVVFGDGALLEVLLHQLVFALGHQFHQRLMPRLRIRGQARRNLARHLAAPIAAGRVVVGLHRHQVYHPVKTIGAGNRQLEQQVAPPALHQVVHQRVQPAAAARLGMVHLVHHHHPRNIRLIGVAATPAPSPPPRHLASTSTTAASTGSSAARAIN